MSVLRDVLAIVGAFTLLCTAVIAVCVTVMARQARRRPAREWGRR